MRSLPQISMLRNGYDPCLALNAPSIQTARENFRRLRASFDFPFWAATSYKIRSGSDRFATVHLNLNSPQHLIIDTFLKDLSRGLYGRYVIAKSPGAVGVTTVVQAYILWRQIFKSVGMTSFSASPSGRTVHSLRGNTARLLNSLGMKSSTHPFARLVKPNSIRRKYYMGKYAFAHYTTTDNDTAARGIDISYVHFSDMAKTRSDCAHTSRRSFTGAMSGVLLQPPTLIVIEGDFPSVNSFFSQEVAAALRGTSLFRLIDLMH